MEVCHETNFDHQPWPGVHESGELGDQGAHALGDLGVCEAGEMGVQCA